LREFQFQFLWIFLFILNLNHDLHARLSSVEMIFIGKIKFFRILSNKKIKKLNEILKLKIKVRILQTNQPWLPIKIPNFFAQRLADIFTTPSLNFCHLIFTKDPFKFTSTTLKNMHLMNEINKCMQRRHFMTFYVQTATKIRFLTKLQIRRS
jgi:hypothetical protein